MLREPASRTSSSRRFRCRPAIRTVNEAKVRELGITPRELEILAHIAAGMSTREITDALYVSENTVKTHSSRLFGKLDVNRRTKAVQGGKAPRPPST